MEIDFKSLTINDHTELETHQNNLVKQMEFCSINQVHNDEFDLKKQLENNIFNENLDIYDESNINIRKICLDVPNIFCNKQENMCILDDEDYIYADLTINCNIYKFIFGENSIQEYVINYIISNNIVIDYNDKLYTNSVNSINHIYAKTIYIYINL